MIPEPTILESNADHVLATIAGVFIAVWRRDIAKRAHDHALAALATYANAAPNSVDVLSVIEPTSSLPSADLRRDEVSTLKALGPKLRSVAIVIEASGIVAATTRSLANG